MNVVYPRPPTLVPLRVFNGCNFCCTARYGTARRAGKGRKSDAHHASKAHNSRAQQQSTTTFRFTLWERFLRHQGGERPNTQPKRLRMTDLISVHHPPGNPFEKERDAARQPLLHMTFQQGDTILLLSVGCLLSACNRVPGIGLKRDSSRCRGREGAYK